MRVVQSYAREPRNQTSFRGINTPLPRRELRDDRRSTGSTSRPSTSSPRSRPRSCSATAATSSSTTRSRSARCSRSSSTSRTSSTRSSSSRSSTTRSSRRRRRSTRSSRCSTRSRRSSTRRPRSRCRGSTATSASRTSGSATGRCPRCCTGSTLDVPAGTTVALVGQTGAGKSTIAKLIARFYDVREGRITIDGHDVRDVEQKSLRRQLGVVPQEGFLFAGTVAENIAFARPEASRGRSSRRRRAVGADGWIRELENGYETQLGERGFRLSLGQRQLIAFARARARRPAHPHPRRGDLVGRHRHRARDRGRPAAAPRGPDGVRDRAPALDDPGRRPDRRARPRRRSSSRAPTPS